MRSDMKLTPPADDEIKTAIDEVNRIYDGMESQFREVEEEGSPAQIMYMQGKKDGMRLAMAILISDWLDRPSLVTIMTAREKWRGSDIEPLMEKDEKMVRGWQQTAV